MNHIQNKKPHYCETPYILRAKCPLKTEQSLGNEAQGFSELELGVTKQQFKPSVN